MAGAATRDENRACPAKLGSRRGSARWYSGDFLAQRLAPAGGPPRAVGHAGGIVALFASIDPAAGAEIVTLPLLLAGLGIGALASQLGAVTVSSSITERDGDDPGHASSQP
jgi:hypothetical protein